jgi:hypothetical protein
MTERDDHDPFRSTPGAPGEDGKRPDWPQDAGAYIGHEPERAADHLPEPLGDDDQRVAAHSTQGTGVGRPDERGQPERDPGGHAEGAPADDDSLREAGQNR